MTYGELAARAGRRGAPAAPPSGSARRGAGRRSSSTARPRTWWRPSLAALEAGAAYVPLDPDYPRERLARHAWGTPARAALVTRRGLAETGSRHGAGTAVSLIDG